MLLACEGVAWPAFSSHVFLLVFVTQNKCTLLGNVNGMSPVIWYAPCVGYMSFLAIFFSEKNWGSLLSLNTYIAASKQIPFYCSFWEIWVNLMKPVRNIWVIQITLCIKRKKWINCFHDSYTTLMLTLQIHQNNFTC